MEIRGIGVNRADPAFRSKVPLTGAGNTEGRRDDAKLKEGIESPEGRDGTAGGLDSSTSESTFPRGELKLAESLSSKIIDWSELEETPENSTAAVPEKAYDQLETVKIAILGFIGAVGLIHGSISALSTLSVLEHTARPAGGWE